MNGLVIKSPYIDDILSGVKKWELRGMNTHKRGKIVLLKSGSGLALGTVNIIGVKAITLDEYNEWDYNKRNNKTASQLPYKITYAYLLEEPILFKKPKPYKHPMGAITWVKLPEDFLADI